jgi:hypothetical protein
MEVIEMAKFRSWNEEKQDFIYFEDGIFSILTSIIDGHKGYRDLDTIEGFNLFNWQNKEQSLEIFDKNNQEIFVGGIVKFGKRYGVVFYNKEQASFDIKPNDGDLCGVPHLNTGSLKYIEIIGHIHEGES